MTSAPIKAGPLGDAVLHFLLEPSPDVLLATGSPASADRLARSVHQVLAVVLDQAPTLRLELHNHQIRRPGGRLQVLWANHWHQLNGITPTLVFCSDTPVEIDQHLRSALAQRLPPAPPPRYVCAVAPDAARLIGFAVLAQLRAAAPGAIGEAIFAGAGATS